MGQQIFHPISTTGSLSLTRPRYLSPEKLEEDEVEFELMLQQGFIRHSDSPWASPLHLV